MHYTINDTCIERGEEKEEEQGTDIENISTMDISNEISILLFVCRRMKTS